MFWCGGMLEIWKNARGKSLQLNVKWWNNEQWLSWESWFNSYIQVSNTTWLKVTVAEWVYAWLAGTILGLTQISYQVNLIGHEYTKIKMAMDWNKQPLQNRFTPPRLGVEETVTIRFWYCGDSVSTQQRVSRIAVVQLAASLSYRQGREERFVISDSFAGFPEFFRPIERRITDRSECQPCSGHKAA